MKYFFFIMIFLLACNSLTMNKKNKNLYYLLFNLSDKLSESPSKFPTHIFVIKLNQKKSNCPYCGKNNIKYDDRDCIVYCADCGAVLMATYPYVQGNRIHLIWGLLL